MHGKKKYENKVVSIYMLMASIVMFVSIVSVKFYYFDEYKTYGERNQEVAEVLAKIPDDASVSVTTYMMPNISMRDEIYRYPEGAGSDYVVFDLIKESTIIQYNNAANELLKNGYELVYEVKDAVLILKKLE